MINYLGFIGVALLLFIFFRGIRLISHRFNFLRRAYSLLVAVELGLWITFLFWLVHYFLRTKSFYNDLVLVLVISAVILLVWYYVKDVVAGFLFKIRHNPKAGQVIWSSEVRGVIKMLATSQLLVEEEGSKIIRIPYSQLLGKSLSLETEDSHAASEAVIHLDVVLEKNYSEIERKIRLTLLQSPWCVPSKPIYVTFLSEPEKGLEVSLHLLDKSYVEAVKSNLKRLLEPIPGNVGL